MSDFFFFFFSLTVKDTTDTSSVIKSRGSHSSWMTITIKTVLGEKIMD